MRTDDLGIPVYSKNDILEIIFQGNGDLLDKILVDINPDELDKFNTAAHETGAPLLKSYTPLNIPIDQFDAALQSDWIMPAQYKELDIEQWVRDQVPPWDPEASRVEEELAAFRERNMINLLRWLKYFVDTCRENGVVWGVGRGSSVASYVLYLIGVHKINSLKYNLDWQEFLR